MGAYLVALTDLAFLGAAILSVAQLYDMKQATWANILAWVGFVSQTAWLLGRLSGVIATGPLRSNDWVDFLLWLAVGLYLVLSRRLNLKPAGAFIFPIVFVIWVLAAWLPKPLLAAPRLTAWLALHGLVSGMAAAAFLLLAVFGIMYIEKERELAQKRVRLFYYQLPALDDMDAWMARLLGFAWPWLTAAIVIGRVTTPGGHALWPVDVWASVVLWAIYGFIFAGRFFLKWRGHRTAVGVMLAFLAVMIDIFGVNLAAIGGAHVTLW